MRAIRSAACIARATLIATVYVAALAAAAQAPPDSRIASFSQAVAGATIPTGWAPLTFIRVAPSRYTLVRDGERVVLKAEAAASASGVVSAFAPPVSHAWVLRWRWKGERLPTDADTTRRATDDAVARIYVTFNYPPDQLSPMQRAIDGMVRALYGRAPPHATLMYVWDNGAAVGTSIRNPYTDRVRNLVVESGSARLSQWLSYERDVAADYRAAFGEGPPPITGVALMTDADNTASVAVAYYGDVTLSVN